MAIPAFSLALPRHVRFGRGLRAEAAGAIAAMGGRVFLLRSGSAIWADTLASDLTGQGATVEVAVSAGEPDLPRLMALRETARAFAPDVIVAVGGGSVIDMGKALAALVPSESDPLDHLEVVGRGLPLAMAPLPFVALPTTAGTGAEATKNAVIAVPDHGRKVSLRDARMLPDLALVDPALTDGCPPAVTLASGLDAVTQVIEPYLSSRANPMTDALCRDAIPRGLAALMRLMEDEDAAARDDMALTSLTGGIALANAGLGAVHGFAGVIGGRFAAPHGAICGRLLVPVLRTNAAAMADAGQDTARFDEVASRIAEVLGSAPKDAFDAFEDWIDRAGLPRLGALAPDLDDRAAIAEEARASSSMKANPVPLDVAHLTRILDAAV